ncbi:TAP42-like protein [Radiomyces spectabilis]|uniref:TAP42-like protein n=1 Tax=Radiomyces spectabilis TaxID=64574 RepID=UPI00221E5B27|nr:TAP42-like protein [Radiomyces spectabilis]KAI8380981.1 TAP42-like protein [Radiomyces spectabilis]
MAQLENLPLGQLFRTGQKLLFDLEESSLASNDPAYQDQVADATARLVRVNELITRLDMFSSNELIEDVNTNDLRFLMVPAYLGNLTLKKTGIENRKATLEIAKDYYKEFLAVCKEHQLMGKQDVEEFERHSAESKSSLNPAIQRQQKIERFKREKAIREKIESLQKQLGAAEEDQDMDDMARDCILAEIDIEILKSLEQLHSINQEMVMVKEMEIMQEMMAKRGTIHDADTRAPPKPRENWGRDKPLLNPKGKPLQPFVITNKRQQLKDQVFKPGWNLPTMTIDEYLQQEKERGNIIEGGGEQPPKPEIDDNDEAAIDAETMKKREWDEFVEANPRGWGNRGNKG